MNTTDLFVRQHTVIHFYLQISERMTCRCLSVRSVGGGGAISFSDGGGSEARCANHRRSATIHCLTLCAIAPHALILPARATAAALILPARATAAALILISTSHSRRHRRKRGKSRKSRKIGEGRESRECRKCRKIGKCREAHITPSPVAVGWRRSRRFAGTLLG